jgi:hypothetical protein
MDFNTINIDEISIDDKLNVRYKGKRIVIKTPILYLPFGVDKAYNNIFLKVQMKTNYYEDDTYEKFTDFITKMETKFATETGKDIRSQLAHNVKYGNTLTTKVPHYNDRITPDTIHNGCHIAFESIEAKNYLVLDLIFDKLWDYKDDILTYKIKVKEIHVMD